MQERQAASKALPDACTVQPAVEPSPSPHPTRSSEGTATERNRLPWRLRMCTNPWASRYGLHAKVGHERVARSPVRLRRPAVGGVEKLGPRPGHLDRGGSLSACSCYERRDFRPSPSWYPRCWRWGSMLSRPRHLTCMQKHTPSSLVFVA